MKTLTFKCPEILNTQLDIFAQKKGMSRSEIIRCALVKYLSNDNVNNSSSFFDLSRDLAGYIEGPSDLSLNKTHLQDYGQ